MSKRNFYQDLETEEPLAGTNSTITSSQLSKQSINHDDTWSAGLVNGMTIRSSDFLESQLKSFRSFTISNLDYYFYEYQTLKSSLCNELHSVSNKYNQLVAEPVLPNSIYILVSTFSGSILVNRRSLPVRFITPVIFGTVAFSQFMPRSFKNARQFLWENEKSYCPEFAKFHINTLIGFQNAKVKYHETLNSGNQKLVDTVHEIRLWCKQLIDF